MSFNFVDTAERLKTVLEEIKSTNLNPSFLFIDIEGINLSRHGSISIIQVLIPPSRTVHLIDIHILQDAAFATSSSTGLNFKAILESERIPKVFFDVRNDSDALYSHFKIDLRCVVDLQLLEYASRSTRSKFVNGLSKCIAQDAALSFTELRDWKAIKSAGQELFSPEKGGRYEVFNHRPLDSAIVDYCIQDVLLLPGLLRAYANRLPMYLAAQIQTEAVNRVSLSQTSAFSGQGRHMAIGPSFRHHRTYTTQSLPFPMDIICSSHLLADHCTLHDTECLDPDRSAPESAWPIDASTTEADLLVRRPATDAKESTNSPQTPLSMTSVVQALTETTQATSAASIGVDEDLNKGKVRENDRPHLGSGRYLSSRHPSLEHHYNDDDDDDGNKSEKDYTACSADDCGYCGRCGY